jgi:hypothetical protein
VIGSAASAQSQIRPPYPIKESGADMGVLHGGREPAVARLVAAGFARADAEKAAAEILRPVVGVDLGPGPVPLGGSKVGGRPHLPQDVAWPDGLAFIAQINFAECKPADPLDVLPKSGILYLFSTCEEGDLGADDEGDLVVRHHRGPVSELVVADYPDSLDEIEGRFVEHRMTFSTAYVLADENELGAGRPDDRDDGVLEAVDRAWGARMLGRPDFFRPELEDLFDPETDTLLLLLSGMRLWRGTDDRAGIYGDGAFFVVIGTDALRDDRIEDAWVIFESGT